MYKLKKGQESFTPVEGPMALKTFDPGKLYSEIPPGEARRFDDMNKTAPAKATAAGAAKPAKAESKEAVAALPPSGKKGGKL